MRILIANLTNFYLTASRSSYYWRSSTITVKESVYELSYVNKYILGKFDHTRPPRRAYNGHTLFDNNMTRQGIYLLYFCVVLVLYRVTHDAQRLYNFCQDCQVTLIKRKGRDASYYPEKRWYLTQKQIKICWLWPRLNAYSKRVIWFWVRGWENCRGHQKLANCNNVTYTVKHQIQDHEIQDQIKLGPTKFWHFAESYIQ